MRTNAAIMAYYAYEESTLFGTYPISTGMEFAERVKSRGVWDYKWTYGYSAKYLFNGLTTTGEDLGNMHYAYVGRVAGAAQIYSGTSSPTWYSSFFDDPTDVRKALTDQGHSASKTTIKVHTHVTNKMKKDASDKVQIHFGDILHPEK
ncbi:hypothetical protein J2Z22_003090 [Paenibacillus forsythiae]|uniref:Bacterial toxin 44 domain-containing protein n=1 Tax=Paenibacillus forsythiae TaxID=365616 RepID=A0ABU3H9M1_9BACL|nr:hypothetical protein [Paenibacillus forsythiae]MDT3427527.1 hypothetical protein [Paenibacillus forsythiae]